MNKETLAEILTGRRYGDEISESEEQVAKASGLVVVFGASDDLMEFRGAINDERGAYNGTTAIIDSQGLLPERDEVDGDEELEAYFNRKRTAQKIGQIKAVWCGKDGYSWTFQTAIPHATFEILDRDEKYCRGIVFEMPTPKTP